jgi:ribosome-binding factor A
MGDDTRQQLSLRGLQNAAGFLQTKVAKRIDTRYTPRLAFVLDLGVKRSLEISQILQSVLPPGPAVSESISTEGNLSDEDAAADWEDDKDADDDVDDDSEDDSADAEDADDENTADDKEAS